MICVPLTCTIDHCIVANRMKEYISITRTVQLVATVPGHIAQLLTCLATDVSLTADPGVVSLILA